MKRKFLLRSCLLLLSVFALSACQSVKPNYVPPTDGGVAKLRITYDALDHHRNLHVNFHEQDLCDAKSTKFVGLLNAGVAGYPNVKEIEISIPAGRTIGISMPQYGLAKFGGLYAGAVNTFSVVQPLISFVPEAGASYVIVFYPNQANLMRASQSGSVIAREALPAGCEVVWENLADKGGYEDSHLRRK